MRQTFGETTLKIAYFLHSPYPFGLQIWIGPEIRIPSV